jgi:hypothetical protein
MYSPSEEGAPSALLLRRTLFRTVPACLYRPATLKMVKSLAHGKRLASAYNFTDFSQTTAVSISAYSCHVKKPNTCDHYHCSISVFILLTSEFEATQENLTASNCPKGVWVWGEGAPPCASSLDNHIRRQVKWCAG